MTGEFERARKFLVKTTLLNPNFGPAWVLYGHIFSLCDENDQAIAAYRTTTRLFPGSHLPWLFLGMEYVRTNNYALGQGCLQLAMNINPDDP